MTALMDAERPKKIPKNQLGTAKKLRSACDFCHQTKVKCSGGNPCNGCEQLSIDCIYSASNRIGRPKGSRNKKTIERVKRYKLENEQRQKAQQAAEQTAAMATDAPPRPAPPLLATTSSDQPASMTVDWPTPDTLDSKIIGKADADDLFTFSCDTTPGMAVVDPVYSLYNANLDHELPNFDFGPNTTDQLPISDSLIAPILHEIDGNQFNPFVDSESEKFISRTEHPISTPPSPALMSPAANDSHRTFSMASITSPSTPLVSPGQTPALTSSSSVLSAPNSSCTCLQDQASLLSRLASTSLISAPLPLDAALECAQQATRTWELFLQCRQCSFRLFESKFDSYLVLTSSMRIILNILNDQLQHFDKPATDRSADALATCDNNATSPSASTISSSSHTRTESRSWMLGMYETSCFENQLISATLLLKIASSIVNLSERLVDVTSQGSREPFSLDSLATKSSGSIGDTSSPTSSKLITPEYSYLMDHDMDDSAMGFNIKFLQQKAQSNDRSAKRFKEEIHARMRHLV